MACFECQECSPGPWCWCDCHKTPEQLKEQAEESERLEREHAEAASLAADAARWRAIEPYVIVYLEFLDLDSARDVLKAIAKASE